MFHSVAFSVHFCFLFSLTIYLLQCMSASLAMLFANKCVIPVLSLSDYVCLQSDLTSLAEWSFSWKLGLILNEDKCSIVSFTTNQTNQLGTITAAMVSPYYQDRLKRILVLSSLPISSGGFTTNFCSTMRGHIKGTDSSITPVLTLMMNVPTTTNVRVTNVLYYPFLCTSTCLLYSVFVFVFVLAAGLVPSDLQHRLFILTSSSPHTFLLLSVL